MLATRPLLSQRILPSVDSPALMTIAISSYYLLAALLPLLSLLCFHLSSLYLFSSWRVYRVLFEVIGIFDAGSSMVSELVLFL